MSPPAENDRQSLQSTAIAAGQRHCPTCDGTFAAGMAFCPTDGSRLDDAPAGTAPASPSTSGLVGKVLADRYRIVRKLGEGGMGEVFEAQHVYIDKRFAIKTLRPEITQNPDAVARFHQEARAASTIGHENIVEVDDFGRLPDGGVYLAMEFLDGCSLAERMREGPISRDEALAIMLQACRGLAAAHDKGILHRDVKPDNVFLARRRGEPARTVVKILDFGIAKVTGAGASQQRLTQTGAVFGTPYYMSPEQALGKPQDPRSDVYSVGVILYELFTGRVPFEGESFMGILSQHITAPPKPPRQVAPDRDIPPPLEQVILRAMAKEADARFPTMSALAEALEAVQRSAGASTVLAAQRPSVAARAIEPPPDMSIGDAAPLELERPSAPDPLSSTSAAIQAAGVGRRKPVGPIIAGVALAAAIAGGVVAMRRGAVKTNATATSEKPVEPKNEAAAVDPNAETHAVYVETVPPEARILDGARIIAMTPGVVRVPVGQPRTVVLEKDGYLPRHLTLDTRLPSVTIQLERDHHAAHSAAPHEAPPHEAAPPHGSVGAASTAPHRRSSDPGYEELPPPPPRNSPPAPRLPPQGAPLNPY